MLVASDWLRVLHRPFGDWGGGMINSGIDSCDEGEYVKGLAYEIDYESDEYPYYLSSVHFMCSSSTLGEHIQIESKTY